MNSIRKRTTLLLSAGLVSIISNPASGGSNNGSLQEAIGFSCDIRTTIAKSFDAWCTNVNANLIKNKCVVAVHVSAPIENCGWQGCGHVSFVNDRPLLQNNNVIEYGISTPSGLTSVPPEWDFQNGTVMPKSPFPRHYLTVDQFVAEKEKCSKLSRSALDAEVAKGSALGKICSISDATMSLNPYYFCMQHQKVLPK